MVTPALGRSAGYGDRPLNLYCTLRCTSSEIKEKVAAGRPHRRMRRTGRFEHRVLLPGEVNPEQVSASLSDGVLTVTVESREGQAASRRGRDGDAGTAR
ncbi:Hsp20/alpha crystallin family protein [Nonomuraea jabiensis]|uniref:Hsp20/alpha crystallin family protein n=1 Tax=Nonomuraea jabiensis TaxID=882448 RepID=UPI003D7293B1